jgi:hypothetical protein
LTASDQGPASAGSSGFRIAAIYFGLVILAGLLFTLYVLLWDGGAHT